MRKHLQKALVGILAAGGLAFFAGCEAEVYPEPGGPVAYYDYDYYPEANVYFYPEGHVYYWNDHDHWRSGRYLPYHYHLNEEQREHLHMRSREPWTERHEEMEHREYREGERHDYH